MSVYRLDNGGKELPSEIRDQLLSLRRLDAESDELDRKLQEVRKRRDAVYHQLERYCKSRAPIRRVPYEVLSIIFSNYPEAQKSRNSSIIRVCKLWRRILMETPSLWNHISLDIGRSEELPLLWAYARNCSIRSGSLPLYIRVDARDFKPNHSLLELGARFNSDPLAYLYNGYGTAAKIMRPIISAREMEDDVMKVHECALLMTLAILRGEGDIFISRWRTFHFYLEPPPVETELVYEEGMRLWDSMDGITDNLVDLVFSVDYSHSPTDHWYPKGFPNLRSLRAFSTSLEVELDRLSLPIATLERLSVLDLSTSEHFISFASDAFTSLRLLELVFYDFFPDADSIQPIRLPALKVLALTGEGYESIMGLFYAPNLTHLCLQGLQPVDEETPSIFYSVTDVMWMSDFQQEMAELRRLLSFTPSLRLFHIRHAGYDIRAVCEEMKTERSAIEYTDDPARWPYVIPT